MTLHYTQPVACIRGEGGAIQGTGWLTLGRYVVTCAHVVDDALKRKRGSVEQPEETIQIDLPFLGKMGLAARIVAWFPARPLSDLVRDPLADIAVLELEGDGRVAGGIEPIAVDRRIPPRGTGFLTYGFPTGFDNGVEASGEVLVQDPGGWLQVRDTQAFGYSIKRGFSGSAVVSQTEVRDLRLIGMVTAADRDETTRLAFLLPAHLICRAFPPLAMPYRGLFAFGEEDADLFFGRGGFVAQVQSKLEQHPVAAVIGPSGSGKSSVVLAGLVPLLRAEGWNIAVCRPLRDPLLQLALGLASLTNPSAADFSARLKEAEAWARRLRKDPGRIVDLARQIGEITPGPQTRTLMVIDQFEELFTQDAEAPDGAVAGETTFEDGSPRQAQFLAVLEAIAAQDPDSSPIRAVATMRVDFMGHALAIRRLAGLLQDTDVKLGPMTAAELSEAVRRPARTFGVEFEDGLAEELVTVMQGRSGGLPLLEFTLDRLWRRQEGRRLTWAAYRGPDGKGGLETALDEHAEEVLRRLGASAEAGVRRVMLRLVRLGDDGAPDARAVARRSEIGEADWPLVQKLADGRSRLLTLGSDAATGEETAEVVHEALIGAWGRLRGWLLEDRDFGLWRQRLKESLQTWSGDSEDYDPLLRGRLLTEATDWLDKRGADLNDSECAFIKASREYARQEADEKLRQAQASEQTAKELAETRGLALRRQQRANILLSCASVLMLITLAVGAYYYFVAREAVTEAESARRAAEATAREAKGRQLGAAALGIWRDPLGAGIAERGAALSIEGWRLFPTASALQAASTALRELPRYRIEPSEGGISAIAFSPNGDLFATGTYDGSTQIIRTADGSEAARIQSAGSVFALSFSPMGDLIARASVAILANGSPVNILRLYRAADGTEIARIDHPSDARVVAFTPRGDQVATASLDGSARLIRVADGGEVARIQHDEPIETMAFSPKVDLLATASATQRGDGREYGIVRLIQIVSGRETARIEHAGHATAVAISPKGDMLAVASAAMSANGSQDNIVRLYRAADGTEIARIDHPSGVRAVAFSPRGDQLATASLDRSARLIRVADGSEVARIQHEDPLEAVAFSPKGDLLATLASGNAFLIPTGDGSEVTRVQHDNALNAVAFSRKGDLLATASYDGSARLIRTTDGSETARIQHKDSVRAVTFSPTGDLLATACDDGSARLIRTVDGSEVVRIEDGRPVSVVAFSPKGDLLATASYDGSARLIRTTDGSEVARIQHDGAINAVAFNAKGDLLATSSHDEGIARLIRTADGSEVARVEHEHWLTDIAFSPKGDLFATGSADFEARMIYTANGREVARIKHDSAVNSIAFSPDGKLLATASDDRSARLIRTSDGSEIGRFDHSSYVNVVAFSPNGSLLAIGSLDGMVRLIRTADGSEVARTELGGAVYSVAFSPRGDLLATVAGDIGRLILTADGSEVARIEPGRPVYAIAFNPSGDLLATVEADGIGRIVLSPDRLFQKLCRERVGRNLSAQEWQRHIGPVQDWAPTCREWASDPSLLAAWQAKQGGGRN